MHRILVLHGPNLNALGAREPGLYGSVTLAEIDRQLVGLGQEIGCEIESLQSSHEGVLIDRLYGARGASHGVLLNPAGLTHTSIALRDAVLAAGVPVVEVHLTNPLAREPFRHPSLISGAALGVVQGFGTDSYLLGLRALIGHLRRASDGQS
jgi:3-dehydroquinate dehydratase-2